MTLIKVSKRVFASTSSFEALSRKLHSWDQVLSRRKDIKAIDSGLHELNIYTNGTSKFPSKIGGLKINVIPLDNEGFKPPIADAYRVFESQYSNTSKQVIYSCATDVFRYNPEMYCIGEGMSSMLVFGNKDCYNSSHLYLDGLITEGDSERIKCDFIALDEPFAGCGGYTTFADGFSCVSQLNVIAKHRKFGYVGISCGHGSIQPSVIPTTWTIPHEYSAYSVDDLDFCTANVYQIGLLFKLQNKDEMTAEVINGTEYRQGFCLYGKINDLYDCALWKLSDNARQNLLKLSKEDIERNTNAIASKSVLRQTFYFEDTLASTVSIQQGSIGPYWVKYKPYFHMSELDPNINNINYNNGILLLNDVIIVKQQISDKMVVSGKSGGVFCWDDGKPFGYIIANSTSQNTNSNFIVIQPFTNQFCKDFDLEF